MSLFDTGIRPAVDAYLKKKAEEQRDYGEYWSASSAGYCMRKVIFDRLKVPKVKEDARKTRVFESGHIFHEWMQRITKEAGLSIAQELELQHEGLMVRGHIDDLVVMGDVEHVNVNCTEPHDHQRLILYDYKTQNSRAFSYQKDRPMSYFHKMQVGTYMYMLRKWFSGGNDFLPRHANGLNGEDITEARILKISKDDLRMSEQVLTWSLELEAEVAKYWGVLNGLWKTKTLPKCTCAGHEGGFMAREAYNDYFYEDEPCSAVWAASKVDLTNWSIEK